MALECPICNEEIDEDSGNVFDHLRFIHDDLDTHALLIATLEVLSEMNINSYHFKV